jgi:S1-C subfamily serine protease
MSIESLQGRSLWGTYGRSLCGALALFAIFSLHAERLAAQNETPSAPPTVAPVPSPKAPAPAPPVPKQSADKPAPGEWIKAVYEKAVDAVVLIETDTGTGSGFFFYSRRHVATALHVVDDAEIIIVRMSAGRRLQGKVVAYSRSHDLALVELAEEVPDAHLLTPYFGNIEIGEPVAVIGHPFSGLEYRLPELRGLLNWSLTLGVVGAVAGSWLQTDAAINPGNSGGPLLNAEGQVLGVVSAKLNDAQGIGLIARIQRVQELVPLIGTQAAPRKMLAFDGLELGFVLHWQDESIDGFSLGAGIRIRKRYPIQLRLGFLGGEIEPDAPTILSTKLERFSAELAGGLSVELGKWALLTPYLGAALFYDRKHDSSLRIDGDLACPSPPCLVQGELLRSVEKKVRLLPLIGASFDVSRLRLSYAYQLALWDLSESQHRFIAAIVF